MIGKRAVHVILTGQAKLELEELNLIAKEQQAKGETNSEEMRLLKSIRQKVEILKVNPTYGDSVPHSQIPKDMEVSNLFRVELAGYWRMLYTLSGNKIEVVAFVLRIIDHPAYDKMFGYRGK